MARLCSQARPGNPLPKRAWRGAPVSRGEGMHNQGAWLQVLSEPYLRRYSAAADRVRPVRTYHNLLQKGNQQCFNQTQSQGEGFQVHPQS